MTGIAILAVAVVAALVFGFYRQYADGRFRGLDKLDHPGRTLVETQKLVKPVETPKVVEPVETALWSAISRSMPDAELGQRATFVQFSSSFCSPCRTTRTLLGDVASREAGVVHLEIDAEQHLELVRALDVRRTPTTLMLDAAGAELTRAVGTPRREQVLAVIPEAVR